MPHAIVSLDICSVYRFLFKFVYSENGSCELYIGSSDDRVSPCDDYFTVGVDYVYIPYSRLNGEQDSLREAVEEFLAALSLLPPMCLEPFSKALCFHFYLPCGINGTYHVPRYLCPDVCKYISETLCPAEWEQAQSEITRQIQDNFKDDLGLLVPNCSDTDNLINFLNLNEDCCTNAGIFIPGIK